MSNDSGINSIERINSALTFISPMDRDVWVKIAMAIKSELDEAGFDIWDQWGSTSPNYSVAASRSVWKSVAPGGKVTIASLFGMAKDGGWQDDGKQRKVSAAEIAQQKAQAERRAAEAEAERARLAAIAAGRAKACWEASKPASDDHPYLVRKGVKAHGLRVGNWEVISEDGEVSLVSANALLVPICDRTRQLHSLQGIFPDKGNFLRRDKDYLKDGAKRGNFHAIGKPLELSDGRRVFIICEGYATGASIHEASGHCVLVTFDRANLQPVAQAIRERQPDAVILIAADNDMWTKKLDGTPHNPGVESGKKAAAAVNGNLVVPQFTDLSGEPTDFNDLHAREGSEEVARQILAGLAPQPDQAPDDVPPWEGEPMPAPEAEQAPAAETPKAAAAIPVDEDELDQLVNNAYFTILGYDGGEYFLFNHAKRQVVILRRGDITDLGLVEQAPANWWESYFPGNKGGINRIAVAEWIFGMAHARGIYDQSRVRGRGAWRDNGRFVFHYGSHLTVDGVKTRIEDMRSAYVYPMAHSMPRPADTPLSDLEGAHLLRVAEMVRWSMPGSAALMAGWSFLAPVCGALRWRPHIWITGAAGSGKSTVQRDFCQALVEGTSIYAQGNSTEPGIRQKLRADARPVLIDEAESNNEREKARIESILALIRQSSSESQAETLKGTVNGQSMQFHIRSMFCLASINTNLDKQADIDRLTKLVIRPPVKGASPEHWVKLEDELHKITSDETLPNRLLARCLGRLPQIMETIAVFTKAAAQRFGTQRQGDQYGTLLAGCWCLTRSHVANEEEALELIDSYNWAEHVEDNDQDDAQKALSNLLNAKIRMGGSLGDLSIYELVREASSAYRVELIGQSIADQALRRHGVRLEEKDGVLLFGTSVPNLKHLLEHTPYATDIRGQLMRLPGATKWNDKTVKFNGAASKCIAIPLDLVMDGTPTGGSSKFDDDPI